MMVWTFWATATGIWKMPKMKKPTKRGSVRP